MNVSPDQFIVNTCEITPVYVIQNTGVTQAKSYILTQNTLEENKPVSDNLKRYYENSGNLENSLLTKPEVSSNKSILKKVDGGQVGNNLKLASFLLPKSSGTGLTQKSLNTLPQTVNTIVNKQVAAASNFVLKPEALTGSTNIVYKINKVPDTNFTKARVKSKKITQNTVPARILPKISPIENTTPISSVQLVRLDGSHYSVNNINNDYIKLVNNTITQIEETESTPKKETSSEPVTNTRILYRVVTPKDLKVVGRNKIVLKDRKIKILDNEEIKETPQIKKITRSGRMVKSPKQVPVELEAEPKPRKKPSNTLMCYQCNEEFSGLYQLTKHYENNPTHIPSKIHTNLFHCLLAIINSNTKEDRANIFVQQIESLIAKLKSLLPCMLKKIDGDEGKSCTINNDLGKLFDMNPGNYNLNTEALDCVKDKDGYCQHNPAPKPKQYNLDQCGPLWIKSGSIDAEVETEACARISAVDKWPTVKKRVWKLKKIKSKNDNKKIKLTSEDLFIELGTEDMTQEQTATTVPQMLPVNLDITRNNSNHVSTISLDRCKEQISSPKHLITQNGHDFQSAIPATAIVVQSKPDTNLQFETHLPVSNDIHTTIDTNLATFNTHFTSDMLQTSNDTDIFLNNKIESTNSHFNNAQFDNEIPSDNVSKIRENNVQYNGAHFENDIQTNVTSSVIDQLQDTNALHSTEFNEQIINKPMPKHTQFHSTHFDIRSSPIKPSSAVFSKFQIKPQEISKYGGQIIAPLQLDDNVKSSNNNSHRETIHENPHALLELPNISDEIEMQCKDTLLNRELNFDKDWVIKNSDENSHESYLRPNNIIQPSLIHVKDESIDVHIVGKELNRVDDLTANDNLSTGQGQSVLQFFDLGSDCLSYPEAEIRNNTVDFSLDLFSFNNT